MVLVMSTTTFAQSPAIDYTDLDHAICIHSKTFNNMVANKNLDTVKMDYGPADDKSCHTVHTDITDYNAHSNYLLRCTTPDDRPAVRLGNRITGGDASRIAYTYTVDANNTILVLDYAAILEDPSHSKAEQPKFTMELFDENGQSLGDDCSSFEFIAGNTTDGWQTVPDKDYVWKDWTTMGVNLRPYIGQTIKIQLTVYDCQPGGHFGYAYYALQVQSDEIKSTICGALEETVIFTAPSGFDYMWYVEGTDPSNPENVLSIDQSFIHETLTMPLRTYMCDVINTENPDCKFTLSATPQPRYPLALFDVDRHTGICSDTLFLINRSGVSADNIHLNDPFEPCNDFHWDFGDGRTSDEANPGYIVYSKPGTYKVNLTVGLDGWTCSSDTTDQSSKEFVVTVGEVRSESFDTVCYGDTLYWHDMALFRNGTYVDTIESHLGCDSICTLHLNYHPQYNRVSRKVYNEALASGYDLNKIRPGIFDTTATDSWEDPYMLDRGTIEHDTICEDYFYWDVTGKTYTETNFYIENIPTSHGCDSLVFLDLRLRAGYYELKQDTIKWGETYVWEGHVDKASGKSEFQQPGSYFDTIPDILRPGCDSVYQLDLAVIVVPDTVLEMDTICQGDSYEWIGHDPSRFGHLTVDSTYMDTIKCVAIDADSVYSVLMLTVLEPIDNPQENVSICAGESYTWPNHVGFENLTKPATYRDTLFYVYGCDSVRFELVLDVRDTTTGDTSAVVCSNHLPFVWYEHTQLETDTVVRHVFEGANQYGCDSIVTFTLTVLDTIATEDGATICSNKLPYEWKDGATIIETFTFADYEAGDLIRKHVFEGTNTCDSVVTFTLTVLDTVATEDGATVCSNKLPYEWKDGADVIYTFTYADYEAGDLTKQHTFEAQNTCDSTVTFTLVVNDTIAITTGATTCPTGLPYEWKDGVTVVETFTYDDWQVGNLTRKHVFEGANTCDSIVTFTLSVMDIIEMEDGATICSNALPYAWKNGEEVVYTFTYADYEAGDLTKQHTFEAQNTCDSTVTFTLTVLDTVATEDGATVCSNSLPYEWKDGATIIETFTYADYEAGNLIRKHVFEGANTCDSVVTFTLTVLDTIATEDGATVCSNSLPYEWKDGATIVETFTYADYEAGDLIRQHVFEGTNTCDSVVTFTLVVLDTIATEDGATICSNKLPYEWKDGTTIVETFTYADYEAGDLIRQHVFEGANTCDSIVTFTLVVNAISAGEESVSEMDVNLPYMWNGIACTETKDYTITLTNVAGCDSVATLHFTVIVTECSELQATLAIDTICGDHNAMQGLLTIQQGKAVSYSVHYGKQDPYGHLQDLQDVPVTGNVLTIPFATIADTTKYIRPDTYPMTVSVVDTCDQEHVFTLALEVLYPSWIMKQRWNDVIALYNEHYNGGYRFSSITWYHEGVIIPGRGDHNSYIYVEGDDSQTLDFGTAYWASLVREGESRAICTCKLRPEFTTHSHTSFSPLVKISSRDHGRHLQLETTANGSYVLYDVCGHQLGDGWFGEEYQNFQINLPAQFTSGTYIVLFRSDEGGTETHKVAVW